MKILKHIVLTILLAAASQLAIAQTTPEREVSFYIENFKIKQGETYELPICISNPGYYFAGFQCDLTVPEGVDYQKNENNNLVLHLTDRAVDHVYTAGIVDSGAMRMLSYSMTNSYFSGNDGAAITVPITVNLEPGTYQIKLSNGKVTESGSDINSEAYTATMTVLPPKDWSENQLYAEVEPICVGQNAVLQVGLNSTGAVYAYSASIVLPEGVTVESVEYSEQLTSVAFSNEYTLEGNKLTISGKQTGTTKKPKPADAGDYIFATFYLNTSSLAAGDYSLVVDDQYLSNDNEENDGEYNPAAYTAHLTVEAAQDIALSDAEEYTATEDVDFANITFTRTFSQATWQALYLPYQLAYDEWSELGEVAELYNVHQYDNDGDGVLETTTIEFNRVTGGMLSAHTPYIFKPNAAGEVVFQSNGRKLFAAPAEDGKIWCESTKERYTLTGTYTNLSGLYDQDAYALSPSGVFVKALSPDQVLKPYRFYLLIEDKTTTMSPASYKPDCVHIVVDGQMSGIDDIMLGAPADNNYYDMLGRKVVNPTTGIYIVNGKKVYVK